MWLQFTFPFFPFCARQRFSLNFSLLGFSNDFMFRDFALSAIFVFGAKKSPKKYNKFGVISDSISSFVLYIVSRGTSLNWNQFQLVNILVAVVNLDWNLHSQMRSLRRIQTFRKRRKSTEMCRTNLASFEVLKLKK